ncbi:MAG: response regulator, partial [Moraxellaceae bacterium]
MKSVLILEDVVDVAQWLAARVRAAFGADTAVVLAHTLAGAQRLVAASRYDLYVVDLGLPDGDGVDFIRTLEAVRSGLDVVVTTIYDDDE